MKFHKLNLFSVIVKLFPGRGQEICTTVQIKRFPVSRHDISRVSLLNFIRFVDMKFRRGFLIKLFHLAKT